MKIENKSEQKNLSEVVKAFEVNVKTALKAGHKAVFACW